MQRLKSKFQHERGGIAVTVALLTVPLLVCLAFVIDAGLLHWEKVQLQNGADAAALAVAQECAESGTSCMGGAASIASGIAGENANDGQAAAELPLAEFIVNPSSGHVTVISSTLNDEGTAVRHPLSSLVSPDAESTIQARAAAEWGTPVSGTTQVALTIAECEFVDLPPQPADATSPTRTWLLINPGPTPTGSACADGSPGGFGWLDGTDCQATVSAGGIVGGEVGITPNPAKNGCSADVLATKLCEVLLIPLYSGTSGSGSGATFTISRFAAFKLTGIKTGGAMSAAYCGGVPLAPPVPAPVGVSKGIQGYFVKYVELGEDFELGEGGPDGGLTIIKLSE